MLYKYFASILPITVCPFRLLKTYVALYNLTQKNDNCIDFILDIPAHYPTSGLYTLVQDIICRNDTNIILLLKLLVHIEKTLEMLFT